MLANTRSERLFMSCACLRRAGNGGDRENASGCKVRMSVVMWAPMAILMKNEERIARMAEQK